MTRQTPAEQASAEHQKRARLAAALRENLKRRKAQGRARREDEARVERNDQSTQAEPPRS